MSQPIVTVLMPVYNAAAHLNEAIRSVLDQTHRDFKLLIINDGSTDDSRHIIDTFKDDRIVVIDLPQNGGLINALNIGIDAIDTKYIARADADDICLPERLKKQVDFMESHSEICALGTGFDNLMPDGSIKKGGRFSPDHRTIRLRHLYQIQIIHGTSMLRTEVLKKHGLKFDPDFKHAEDYDFFDRLASVNQIANIPDSLYLIRHHQTRVSAQFSYEQRKNSDRVKIRILKEIGVDASQEQLEQLQWLMYQNYGWFDAEKCVSIANFLSQLIRANYSTSYFEPEFLRHEMSTRFLHLCNHLARLDSSVISTLTNFKEVKYSDNPKLYLAIWVKSILAKL